MVGGFALAVPAFQNSAFIDEGSYYKIRICAMSAYRYMQDEISSSKTVRINFRLCTEQSNRFQIVKEAGVTKRCGFVVALLIQVERWNQKMLCFQLKVAGQRENSRLICSAASFANIVMGIVALSPGVARTSLSTARLSQ